MQVILTRYFGPSNVRGSRIYAQAQAGRICFGYDHSLSLEENHEAAAQEYARRKNWLPSTHGALHSGCLPSGDYCHVFVK